MVDFKVAGKQKAEEILPEIQEKAEDTGKALVVQFRTAFDIEPPRIRFARYQEVLDEVVKKAKALDIKDEDSLKEAVLIGTSAKKLAKEIDSQKKETTAPYRSFTQAVNSFADQFLDKLEVIDTDLKAKITRYTVALEQKKREAMLAQQKAKDEFQKKLDYESKKSGTERVVLPEVTEPKAKSPVRSESGSAYQREYWNFAVTDIKLVPWEYLGVLDHLVREAINKRGKREIPGLRIFVEPKTSFRTS